MKCPNCGKEITGEISPIDELKQHIRSQIQRMKHRLGKETWAERNIDKWQSWLKAIEELESKIKRE